MANGKAYMGAYLNVSSASAQNSTKFREDLEKTRGVLGDMASDEIVMYIKTVYSNSGGLHDLKIHKTMKLVMNIYEYVYGNLDDFHLFLKRNKLLFGTSYNRFKYRAAILYNFGLLEDVFINNTVMFTDEFKRITTKDLYRILLLRHPENYKELNYIINNISKETLNSLRKYDLLGEELIKFYNIMIEDINKKNKKNRFMNMMLKKK